MQGSDETPFVDWATRILPLSNYETVSRRTNRVAK